MHSAFLQLSSVSHSLNGEMSPLCIPRKSDTITLRGVSLPLLLL